MSDGSRQPNRGILLLAAAYLGVAAVGTAVAVREELPGRFLGIRTGLAARQDFVFGMGTALSGPLAFLVAIACATLGVTSPAPATRRRSGLAFAALGACGTLGMLGEPITYRTLSRSGWDGKKAAIVLANVALPASLAGLAWRTVTDS